MTAETKRLARLTAEGDEEAARQLARVFLRKGYMETEGKPRWIIQDKDTGKYWGAAFWSDTPHLYGKGWAMSRAHKLKRGDLEGSPPWHSKKKHENLEVLEIVYAVIQRETI